MLKIDMGTLFDDLDKKRVNIGDLIEKDNQEFCINPDNLLKVLCPDDEPKLVISSGVNKSYADERVQNKIFLIRDMLAAILGTASMSKLIILDEAHNSLLYQYSIKRTSIMLAFRVNVRSTYSAMKLLNAIKTVFLGRVGSFGFSSPDINLVAHKETIFSKYLVTLNFYFFKSIRFQYEDNDYEKFSILFDNLGVHLKEPKVELKKAIDRMDCR